MPNATHQPAPWKFTIEETGERDLYPQASISDASGGFVAEKTWAGPAYHAAGEYAAYRAAMLATVALMTAAPDLLDACEALLEFFDNGTPVQPGALVVDDLRAAVATAKAARH